MTERRDAGRYLVAAVPVRLVEEGARVALALAAVVTLRDIAVGAAMIAVFTAPSIVAAPLIGGALDALKSPRRTMLLGALIQGAALVLAAFIGQVPLAVIFVGLFIGGCALPLFLGGLSSFVADVMPGDGHRAFAVDALSYNIAGVAGPAIVAVLAGLLSPQGALFVLAAVIVVGGLLLQTLPIHGRGASARPRDVARGIAAGMRHLVGHRPLALTTFAGSLNQVGAGATPVVAVALAVALGAGSAGGAWLIAGMAIGGIVGAALAPIGPVARRLARLRPRLVMALGFGGTGVFTLLAAVTPGYALTLLAFALAGVPLAPALAAMLRIRQIESPAAVRAQVFTVGAGLRVGASALGAALVGFATHLDPRLLVALAAVPWLASGAILLEPRRRIPGATSTQIRRSGATRRGDDENTGVSRRIS